MSELTDGDVRQLRVHVGAATTEDGLADRAALRARRRRLGGRIAAVMVVLLSIISMGVLFSRDAVETTPDELANPDTNSQTTVDNESDQAPILTTTTVVPAAPVDDVRQSFDELRYLPAGTPSGFNLSSIVRSPTTAPLGTFVRSSGSGLNGVVYVESIESVPDSRPGVLPPEVVVVRGVDAMLYPAGDVLEFHLIWDHPELGLLRARGSGVPAEQLVDVVNAIDPSIDIASNALPSGWSALSGSAPVIDQGAVFRATYRTTAGDIVAVLTHAAEDSASNSVPAADCVSRTIRSFTATECPNHVTWVDDDDVRVTVIGAPEERSEFIDVLRPVSENDARIRADEIEPRRQLEASAAFRLLYLPPSSSDWALADWFVHASGRVATTPALVLVERSAPDNGEVLSMVVVDVLPAGSEEPGFVDGDDSDGTVTLVAQEGDHLVKIRATNHTVDEVAVLREQLTTGPDDGLQYGQQAQSELETLRAYDIVFRSLDPAVTSEGAVFGAVIADDTGRTVDLRVSVVPGLSPDALAIDSDQFFLTEVRGRPAALVVNAGRTTLTWEETPGVKIELSESESDDGTLFRLLDLATEQLQRTDTADVRFSDS